MSKSTSPTCGLPWCSAWRKANRPLVYTFVKLNWTDAFTFVTTGTAWLRKLFLGGLFILLLPPLGWPLALGYRKEVAARLVSGRQPLLPSWQRSWRPIVAAGWRSAGVILAYFTPFLLMYWLLGLESPAAAQAHVWIILSFLLAVVLLPPVSLPLLPPLYALRFSWITFSPAETALLALLFAGTVFLMPAAFLEVSLTGRFRTAFRLLHMLRFITARPRYYLEAWFMSLLATFLALLTGPLAPWGIFWSYQVIVYAFNNALFYWPQPDVQERFRHSRFKGGS